MNRKLVVAVIVNALSILLPTAVLYAHYGLDAKIDPHSREQLVSLVVAMLAGFVGGLLGSAVLRSTVESVGSTLAQLATILKSDVGPSVKRS